MRQLLLVPLCLALVGMVSFRGVHAEDKSKSAKEERFDLLVREDLFAGFGGDKEALERGIKKCEETLAKNPKHAEAMVWRGAGRVFHASVLFAKKDNGAGIKLWTAGLEDMDKAVELDPKNPGVRIPRAAVLLPSARNVPEGMKKPLLTKALDDFQTMYELQKNDLDKLGKHPRGELRMGLADVYRLMNEPAKSKEQLDAVLKELPNTKYAERAEEWLKAKADAKLEHTCIGCHRN